MTVAMLMRNTLECAKKQLRQVYIGLLYYTTGVYWGILEYTAMHYSMLVHQRAWE